MHCETFASVFFTVDPEDKLPHPDISVKDVPLCNGFDIYVAMVEK